MNDFYSNLISTVLGVIIGGLITIKINNSTNTKLLKKEHELKMLQEIKYLLNDWSMNILEDVTTAFKEPDLDNFKTVSLCKDLQTLIVYFNSNMSVLKDFKDNFEALRKKELSLQIKQDDYKSKLARIVKKHNLSKAYDTYEYTEGAHIWEEYAGIANNINEGVQELIVSIDEYISNNILKY